MAGLCVWNDIAEKRQMMSLVQDGSCPPTDRDSKDVVMIPTVFISLLQGLWTPVDYHVMAAPVAVQLAT